MDMCRACMTIQKADNEYRDMQLLFNIGLNETVSISQMFLNVSTIVCKDGDKICPNCFIELSDAFSFQQKCIKSDKEMKNLFSLKFTETFIEDVKNDNLKLEDDLENLNNFCDSEENNDIIEKPNPKNKRNASHLCTICKKGFDRKYRLQRHMNVHRRKGEENQLNFECEICKCLFANEKTLERHTITHNNVEIENFGFKCPYCPRKFEKKVSRSAHIRTHKRTKNQEVVFCDSTIKPEKIFNIEQENNVEMNTTTDENPLETLIKKEDTPFDINLVLNEEPESLLNNKDDKIIDEIINTSSNETDTNKTKNDSCEEESDCSVEKPNPSNIRRAKHNCPVCDKVFDRKYRLNRHLNVHNPTNRPFECNVCKWRFAHEENLKRHELLHTDLMASIKSRFKPGSFFKCPECPRKFEKRESLSAHMRTHKKSNPSILEKQFKCGICPKSFLKYNSLTRHLYTHDENKVFKCNLCEKAFALKGQLLDHLNFHSGVKPYVCKFCNKGFQQSSTLKDHIRTHTGDQPFLCSECGRKFNNGSNLRQHILRHKGTKPFQCSECPSSFACKGGLKSHMSTHTKLRPYVCDVCSSAFTKMYSLRKHTRIHTGEKPYGCTSCSMRFTASNHLKRHMRTHTGEKPYSCKFCERTFAQSNDLIKHLRSHVGEKVYQCEKCSTSFRLYTELRAHNQEHFKKEKEEQQSRELTDEIVTQTDNQENKSIVNRNCSTEDVYSSTVTNMETINECSNDIKLFDAAE